MNVTKMPVQILLQGQSTTRKKIPEELSNVFQGLLEHIKLPNTNVVHKKMDPHTSQVPKEVIKELLESLPKETVEQLEQLLAETGDLNKAVQTLNLDKITMQQVNELLEKITQTGTSSTIPPPGPTPNFIATVVPINKKELQQQLQEISKKVESLLSRAKMEPKNVAKLAPEILKLLDQWTSLEKKLTGAKEGTNPLAKLDTFKSAKVESVWRELVNTYQKRNQLMTTRHYNSNTQVTSSDVEKWIGKALAKDVPDKVPLSQVGPSVAIPTTKVEQYIIHVNQPQNTQNAGKQLVDKVQELMHTSKFLTLNNGAAQLSISLRPANLGEMMIKLTQVNGEMTVKILVASAAAKDMLEANMHQLKHMFSPQQVMIEKQDVTVQQGQTTQQENEQQSMSDNDQSQSEDTEQEKQNKENEDFGKAFHEILMNEKV